MINEKEIRTARHCISYAMASGAEAVRVSLSKSVMDGYTDGAVLDVTPKPDSLIRVFMAWYATDTAVELSPQAFDTPTRDGFTVVEWGGSQVREP